MSVSKMMGVLRELENTPSTLDKEQLLKAAGEGIPFFKSMLLYALSPYKKFGIQALATIAFQEHRVETEWAEIALLLDASVSRQLTGTQQKVAIGQLMARQTAACNELFKRVILKDLRCGVGATLVNKVFPGLIPEFGIMLANPLVSHHIKTLKKYKKVYWQDKKNGDRMIAMIPPRTGHRKAPSRGLTRKGHDLLNYNMVLQNLEFIVDQHPEYRKTGLVFDGEVIVKDFFETRGTKKLAGNEQVNAVFHCFDMVSLPQWEGQASDLFSVRRVELAKIANGSVWGMFQNLQRVRSYPVDIDSMSMEYFDDLRDRAVVRGEEGIIIRPDTCYNHKSRSSMMKHKKMKSMDCMIIEVLAGDEEHKFENTAGRILVRMDDGETLCYAGLKLKNAERDEMWANRSLYAGKMCEIAYQDKTVSKQGQPKLQFPVYKQLREDLS